MSEDTGAADPGGPPPSPASAPIVSVGAAIDLEELNREVVAAAAGRASGGSGYPQLALEAEEDRDPLPAAVAALRDAAELAIEPPVGSPRRLLGRSVRAVKLTMRVGLRWYTRWLVGQLQTFAANAVATTSIMAERLEAQDGRLSELRAGLEREKARVQARFEALPALSAAGPPAPPGPPEAAASPRLASRQVEDALDYVCFEDRFRGDPEEVGRRQSQYLDLLRGLPGPIADVGCGRGEMLALLGRAGIEAYGVDQSAGMVERCRAQGLEVRHQDLLAHLAGLPDGSLGGIFCAQVLEHLDPAGVVRFFQLAAAAIAQRGVLIAETLNPRSLVIFANALYTDLGHVRPLHPLTLSYLAEAAGFGAVEVRFCSPVPEASHLKALPESANPELKTALEVAGDNFRRLDDLLFGPQDFAVVARR